MDEKNKSDQKEQIREQTDTKTNSASASPSNNNSDLSNSSANSSENNEVLQDSNCNDIRKSNSSTKEDGGNSDKVKNLLRASNAASITTKEDANMVLNVKKEETSLSPMSPVGFESISNNEITAGCGLTTGKTNELSGLILKSNVNEKTSSNSNNGSCKEESNATVCNSANISNLTNNGNNQGISQQQNTFGNSMGSSVSNCLEYMQQQNHVFVFSTQLANKGAESVLSGQFQTIIAYHCTQPSTKSFLEEFFMKNPMKMSKLPRNMMGMGMGHGTQWSAGVNASSSCAGGGPPKGGLKATSNSKSVNFNLINSNIDQKTLSGRQTITASSNVPGFLDGNDNDSDLMQCWESNRNVGSGSNDVKIAQDNPERNSLANKNLSLEAKLGLSGNDQIPSLQGVKVPDENLTPQQRQHREEQLAKLKKMNQFLFPENEATQKLNKIANDSGGSMNNLMMGIGGQQQSNVSGLAQVGVGSTLRNNLVVNQKPTSSTLCENENMPGLGNAGGSEQQINTENMTSLQGQGKAGNVNVNVNCESLNSNLLNMNMPGNAISCGPQASNMLVSSDTSITNNGAFSQCGNNDDKTLTGPQDLVSMDWPKLQNQYMDERLKGGNKPPNDTGINRLNLNSSAICGNVRPTLTPTTTTTGSNNQRSGQGQGPPPPYHSTQRSASVPIATQSPNPSSPNNPTSSLSLPSPASAGGNGPSGVTLTTSPNMDVGNLSNNNLCSSSGNSVCANLNSSTGHMNKSQDRTSPLNNNSNTNRNRNLNQLNSNPSTPLSHMSPKDMELFNANNVTDSQPTHLENRFPAGNPGFNFPPHMQNSSGNINNFKAQIERQNSGPGANPPFGRRTENMPLNPNSGRALQNKLGSASFDPISSLAQMSQQLTSCVSSGVGNNSSNVGCSDLNMPTNISLAHQNMDGILQNMEGNMMEGNNISNLPSQLSGTGSGIYGPSNCNMNAIMMGSMNPQHRLMNPKLCGPAAAGPPGSFNSSGNNSNPNNFHNVLPPNPHPHHRLRMPGGMNFNNFNVSPNIQVKASTPNTIQYMPVRPQNNNNMRAPPSLDFLQRYANPSSGSGSVGIDGHSGNHLGQINPIGVPGSSDNNKMVNNLNNGSGGVGTSNMNFFPHCNQIESEELTSGNGLMPSGNHDINMIRGLRPMMRHMGPGTGSSPQRMIAPSNNGPIMQFSGGQPPPNPDSLDCAEMSNLFGSGNPNSNTSQLFHISGGSHKTSKSGGMVMGPGIGAASSGLCSNLSGSGAGILPHEHNGMPSPINQTGMVGPAMSGGNGPQLPIVSSGPNTNNMNYKPFVGPTSNADLKYAQQYHSFQQQLYATSTRSQHQNGSSITSVASNVQNSNTPFFVNK